MIGTLGGKIIFTVSRLAVLSFKDMQREIKGRWTTHEVLGGKPRAEFLGPDNETVSLTIHLSMKLGVWPRVVLEAIREMVETGEVNYLVVGFMPVTRAPLRIVSASEAWNTIYQGGVLYEADVTLELEEYV